GAGLGAERAELFDFARGEGNLDAFAREQPRQRCAQSFAGADDQGNLVLWNFHERSPEKTGTWYLGAQSRKATRGGQDHVEIPLVGDGCILRAQHAERPGVIFLWLLGPDLVAECNAEFLLALGQRTLVGQRPRPELPSDLPGQDRHQRWRQRGPCFEFTFG